MISLIRLRKGSVVLDAGCGQGFFANLFMREGMVAYGTDISHVGIQSARQDYPSLARNFFVSDLENPPISEKVDCVFVRSCSLHNTAGLGDGLGVTRKLLVPLRPRGVLLFAYNTNLSQAADGWANHNLADVRSHFHRCGMNVQLYFINKLDTLLTGRYSFNKVFTAINAFTCKMTGLSGEVVVIFRKNH